MNFARKLHHEPLAEPLALAQPLSPDKTGRDRNSAPDITETTCVALKMAGAVGKIKVSQIFVDGCQ